MDTACFAAVPAVHSLSVSMQAAQQVGAAAKSSRATELYSRVLSSPSLRLSTIERQQMQTSKEKRKCVEGASSSQEPLTDSSYLMLYVYPLPPKTCPRSLFKFYFS